MPGYTLPEADEETVCGFLKSFFVADAFVRDMMRTCPHSVACFLEEWEEEFIAYVRNGGDL